MTERERLIELLSEYEYDISFCDICHRLTADCNTCKTEQFADYLIANGVIVPPCKVGDTVYQTDGVNIYESEVCEISLSKRAVIYYTENAVAFDETALGKSIFLIKEEAEKALKEREGI